MPAQFKHQGSEKKKYVKQMFNDISSQYDTFNLLSSFGIDRYWRYNLIKKLKLSSNNALLDIATGTGDVAFSAYKKYNVEVNYLPERYNLTDLFRKSLLYFPNHSWWKDELIFKDVGYVYHFNAIPQNERHVEYWMERTYKELCEG